MADINCIEFKRGWLRGFFDGEGCAYFSRKPGTIKPCSYGVAASNTDAVLVSTCKDYLDSFGIRYSVYYREKQRKNCKPLWVVTINSTKSLKLFRSEIGFFSPKKIDALATILAWLERPGGKYGANCLHGHIRTQKNTHWLLNKKTGYTGQRCRECAADSARRSRAKVKLRLVS